MPKTYQKIIAVTVLAGLLSAELFLPITATAQSQEQLATDPFGQGLSVEKVTPTFAGGLPSIFNIGGVTCAAGGLLGGLKSLGSSIASLGSLAAEGLSKLFGGGSSVTDPLTTDMFGQGLNIPDPNLTSDMFGQGLSVPDLSADPFGQGLDVPDPLTTDPFGQGLNVPESGFGFGGLDIGTIGSAIGIAGKLFSFFGGGGGEVPVREQALRQINQKIANSTAITADKTSQLVKKECSLDPIVKAITAIILRSLTAAIIGWIQGGSGGFVQDFETELRRQIDGRAGEFLNQLTGINLCGNIGAFLNISLRFPTGMRQRFECTLSDIIANVQNFFRNFEEGGWPVFIRVALEPQNNPYGAYLIAVDAKIAAEAAKAHQFESRYLAGSGFLGYSIKDGFNCITITGKKHCWGTEQTKTPGHLVGELLNKSYTSNIDWLVIADEVDEAIYAIINALISKLLTTSFGDDGEGTFAPELAGGEARVDRGDFANSGLDNQYAAEIMRADAAIIALDSRELKALQEVFAKGAALKALENTLASLQSQLAAEQAGAADPAIVASLQAQITSTQKSIDDTKRQMKDNQNLFLLAMGTKRSIVDIKSVLLQRRALVINTTNLNSIQSLAEERITLTNLLDGFLEAALIGVGDLRPNADLQINILQHIQEAQKTGQRAIGRVDSAFNGIVASQRPGFESHKAILISRKFEIQSALDDLEPIRADLMTSLPQPELIKSATEALAHIDVVTRLSHNGDVAVNQALAAFAGSGGGGGGAGVTITIGGITFIFDSCSGACRSSVIPQPEKLEARPNGERLDFQYPISRGCVPKK